MMALLAGQTRVNKQLKNEMSMKINKWVLNWVVRIGRKYTPDTWLSGVYEKGRGKSYRCFQEFSLEDQKGWLGGLLLGRAKQDSGWLGRGTNGKR